MTETTLQDIAISNAVIHEKLDTLLLNQTEIKNTINNHDSRISVLEHSSSRAKGFLWTISGVGTVVAVVSGVWNDVFVKWFGH